MLSREEIETYLGGPGCPFCAKSANYFTFDKTRNWLGDLLLLGVSLLALFATGRAYAGKHNTPFD